MLARIKHHLLRKVRRHRKQPPMPPLPPDLRPHERGAKFYFEDSERWAALRLLWEHLTPAQRKEYAATRTVTVCGSAGGRYRLHGLNHAERLDQPGHYCLHIVERPDWLPVEDHVLAKKLLLECNEPLFLRTANRADFHH